MQIGLRPARPTDADALLDLNAAAVPAVNGLDDAEFRGLVEASHWLRVAEADEEPVGFLLGLEGPGLDYPSENYRWFAARYAPFWYVDRVVVAASAQGNGIGGLLYDAFARDAASVGVTRICAEVNLRPPNPGSLRFHERHGFRAVGEQETKGGAVTVRLLSRRVVPHRDGRGADTLGA